MSNPHIVCPVCGAENDPDNQFCDQCGAHLILEPISATPTVSASSPAVLTLTCTICDSSVLPGQVFCDNCGADLRVNPPADELPPTMLSQPADLPVTEIIPPPPEEKTVEETAPPSTKQPASTTPDSDAPPASTDVIAPAELEPTDVVEPIPAPEPEPATQPESKVVSEAEPHVEPVSEPASPPPGTRESLPAPKPGTAPIHSKADHTTEKCQHLEEEIANHRTAIAQMEHILATYPAGSEPGYLVEALANAKQTLARTEESLASLAAPDPAEIARLEAAIERHRQTATQIESMLTAYPTAARPNYLADALANAHQALAQAEAELIALHSGQPPSHPMTPPMPAPSLPNTGDTILHSPPQPTPPPTPVPGVITPRLIILEGGKEVPIPINKSEIIVGREDPVSNIYPEIDLTPFGGETGGVSRQHARIDHKENQWSITDLHSTNYTRVNGNKLQPNVPTPIADGTRLQFGRVAAILRL